MKCPGCGAQSEGAFCSDCGTPLKGAKCRECAAPLSHGARFCNNCGKPVGAVSPARSDGTQLPWIIAGAALVLLIGVIAWPALRGSTDTPADGRMPIGQMDQGVGGAVTDQAAPGPLSGTPREQADRLFNRVMSERESGDTTRAKFFLPMALQAYGMAGPLDADGYYHLSLLQTFGGDYKAALASADQILATSPNHLLALYAAADAARASGDQSGARKYFQRFLAAYNAESTSTKPEYRDHGNMLPQMKTDAEAFVR